MEMEMEMDGRGRKGEKNNENTGTKQPDSHNRGEQETKWVVGGWGGENLQRERAIGLGLAGGITSSCRLPRQQSQTGRAKLQGSPTAPALSPPPPYPPHSSPASHTTRS